MSGLAYFHLLQEQTRQMAPILKWLEANKIRPRGKSIMPYVSRETRERLDAVIPDIPAPPSNGGELNYRITREVSRYLALQTLLRPEGVGNKYEDFNTAIGALECAKQELYRRMVAPYEDTKIKENGDVYIL